MAKRFIDTGLFDDEWFAELALDCKIFWVYYVTKCDHAGLLKYNKRLIEFQTGIKSLDTVIKHFDDRLVRVNEQLLFCPKFIAFQYPKFPNSNVKQQSSAIDLLVKNGLWSSENNEFIQLPNSKVTVTKVLPKTYDNDNEYVNGNDNEHDNGKAEILKLPFPSTEFWNAWVKWVKYRSEIKKPYRSKLSKEAALKKLGTYTEPVAIEMIENSIANQWQGLFELKGNNKPNVTGVFNQ